MEILGKAIFQPLPEFFFIFYYSLDYTCKDADGSPASLKHGQSSFPTTNTTTAEGPREDPSVGSRGTHLG